MSDGVMVRVAREDDLGFVLGLQESSHGAPRWSAEQYRGMVVDVEERLRRVLLIAEVGRVPVGYAAASAVLDEAELEAIVVREERRRAGIGRALALAVAAWAERGGAEKLRLEVRASNAAAVAMYETMRFVRVGLRPRYYSDPEEDAVLMSLPLGTG